MKKIYKRCIIVFVVGFVVIDIGLTAIKDVKIEMEETKKEQIRKQQIDKKTKIEMSRFIDTGERIQIPRIIDNNLPEESKIEKNAVYKIIRDRKTNNLYLMQINNSFSMSNPITPLYDKNGKISKYQPNKNKDNR